MQKLNLLVFFLAGTIAVNSQENYAVSEIDPLLLVGANAVVRNDIKEIVIKNLGKVKVSTDKLITVLNKSGETYVSAYEFYDDSKKIKNQEAVIFNSSGSKIARIKQRDFKDQSNFPSFVLFSDTRLSYLDYTPREYPYTIHYTSEVEYSNSIFLPEWRPLPGYAISVEHSLFNVDNKTDSPVRYRETGLVENISKYENDAFHLKYTAEDLKAIDYEDLSPSFPEIAPRVMVALERFYLEGVAGKAKNWKEFGSWQYKNLIEGHDALSQETLNKINALVANEPTIEGKAQKIYEYVQNNTRYVAIELGLGGWEPAYAKEVDELGYGDCKGLTNYTMALLKSQDIEAYYTVVHAGEKKDMNPNFPKLEGNHVILNIPRENKEDIWLECTNPFLPFNYLGDFTDDRYVLKIKPEGGELVKTKTYTAAENLEKTIGRIKLQSNGDFTAKIERESYGIPYGDIFLIERQSKDKQQSYYRKNWSHLKNVNFENLAFSNDRENIIFKESLKFNGERFADKAGSRLLFHLNFLGRDFRNLQDYQNRKLPMVVQRGKTFDDSYYYELPENFKIEALPKSSEITSKFGRFTLEVTSEPSGEKLGLVVTSFLELYKGEWDAEQSEDYANFITIVENAYQLKAVIVKEE